MIDFFVMWSIIELSNSISCIQLRYVDNPSFSFFIPVRMQYYVESGSSLDEIAYETRNRTYLVCLATQKTYFSILVV